MKLHFWNRRQWLVFGAVFVLAAVLVWFGDKWYFNYRQSQSHQASGILLSMTDNQLLISGDHISDVVTEIPKYSLRQQHQDFTVIIDSNTKLVRTVWHIPVTRESLIKNNTNPDPATIQIEQQAGSVDDFKNVGGMSIVVKTANNSINETTLKAIEIDYIKSSYAK